MALPHSIRGINELPEPEKRAIYTSLLPDWLYTDYNIDRATLTHAGQPAVWLRCPAGSRAFEITVKQSPAEIDPILYLNMADTFNHQLIVLLLVVNDPKAPRFHTDMDEHGNRTHFGTSSRNLYAERGAMNAGLAPGQVRAGLRVFKRSVPIFEQFVLDMGHELFLIEPLAYHNAIVFEKYGFNYMRGYKDMLWIHDAFQPGGDLHHKLTLDNPFRQPEAWQTVRKRSWAIHDGILGHPFTGFQMYRRIGTPAGVNTFPDAQW
ncbi:MAG: hypothetical protein H7Y11_05660 [Armatimonadetes bacterium]|nr:hypothetical protein [Anaerolineae bacterium]